MNELREKIIKTIESIYEQNGCSYSSYCNRKIADELLSLVDKPNLATKEHDEAVLREFVDFLPKEFWEDEDHAVGGYISKKDLRGKVGDFIASRKDKPTTDLKVDNSGEGE